MYKVQELMNSGRTVPETAATRNSDATKANAKRSSSYSNMSHRAARGTIKETMETKVVPELPKRKEVPVVGEHLRRLALQLVVVPRLRHPKGASLATIARSPGSSGNPVENLGNPCTFSVGAAHAKNHVIRSTSAIL